MFSQSTRTAVAAMARLAEAYDRGKTRVSAAEIARSRKLKRPFVGKVLSELSRSGLVEGATGPGGGFTLTRAPSKIRIADVLELFARGNERVECPFGHGVCGDGDPCPLHEGYVRVQSAVERFYERSTFAVFQRGSRRRGKR